MNNKEISQMTEFQKNMERSRVADIKIEELGLRVMGGFGGKHVVDDNKDFSFICNMDTRDFPLHDNYDIVEKLPKLREYKISKSQK